MRFFTATTIAALSALSLVSASPYNVEARDLAERQVLELTVGPVNLDVQALVGPETCPPIDEDGITARAFAVVSLGEAVNAVVNVAGLAEITGTVTATADVCVCARVGLDVGLIDLPVDIQAQALVGLRAAADLTLDTNLITFLDNVVAADVDLTPTNVSGHCQGAALRLTRRLTKVVRADHAPCDSLTTVPHSPTAC